MERLIVTLDGPAGTGKSTVAHELAHRLGIDYLDTGAMYRGVSLRCVESKVDIEDHAAVGELTGALDMRFNWAADPPHLMIDGRDVTDRLRDADVRSVVSRVAAISAVRKVMVKLQRQFGKEHPRLVTEGRDQGTVVFPDATAKFYLDASPEVRARRRVDQLHAMNKAADEAKILQELVDRDARDAGRTDGPLCAADDAEHVDTTSMSLQAVIDDIEQRVHKKLASSRVDTPTHRTAESDSDAAKPA